MPFEMNLPLACLLLACGLIVLAKSADLMVAEAVALAARFGVSSLVIGLTVVAMGTSAPEAAAGISAAARGAGDIAVGDVYGSNIANLALVGGLCAIISPIYKRQGRLWPEIFMLVSILALWPITADGLVSRLESLVLLSFFAVYILLVIKKAQPAALAEPSGKAADGPGTGVRVLLLAVSIAGLAAGAEMTIRGACFLGRAAGMNDAVVGLTIVAVGTSLPELATSVVASLKGHNDLSIGNLVGSNIFNASLATGLAGLIKPLSLGAGLAGGVDYIAVLFTSILFAVMALLFRRIGRCQGILLMTGYTGYVAWLLVR